MRTARVAVVNAVYFLLTYLLGGDEHVPRHKGADAVQHQGEVDQVKPGIGEKDPHFIISSVTCRTE